MSQPTPAQKTSTESVTSTAQAIRRGDTSAEAIVSETLQRAHKANGTLHAFTKILDDDALSAARTADQELKNGIDRGPMHGIPYGLKDIYDVAGVPTSCSSRLRINHVASTDSTVAARFKAAGAILIGKLATHEFAIGIPGEESVFPPARNPWNIEHIPGGSSSGSGASVGGGLLQVATGSCTGGSIRGPAAWCGIVGLKPTYGRVSRRGVEALAWSLDHCGPMTRTVEECAIALQIMAGHDPLDGASQDVAVPDYRQHLDDGVAGMKIGVPRAFFENSPKLGDDTRRAIELTIAQLRESGALVEDVSLPDFVLFNACGRIIMAAEAYAAHRERLGHSIDLYETRTASRIAMGAVISSADYLGALRVRSELTGAVNAALTNYDALLTASSLDTAPRADPGLTVRDWPLQTITFNVTGHPAISVPVGLSTTGLPLSIQLVGRPFAEDQLLRIARSVELSSGWEATRTPVWGM